MATRDTSIAAPAPAPNWEPQTSERSGDSARAVYRGLALFATSHGLWHVSGAFRGFNVLAHDDVYGVDIDHAKASAIAAADDLVAHGWEPRP